MRECEKKEPGGWGSANKWQRGQAPPKTNTEPQGNVAIRPPPGTPGIVSVCLFFAN